MSVRRQSDDPRPVARKREGGRDRSAPGSARGGAAKAPPLRPGPRPVEVRQARERLAVTVGRVLEERWAALGLPQEKLGQWCGLSRSGLGKIFRQGVPDSVVRIALALGCRVSEVYAEAERRLAAEDRRREEAERRVLRESLGLVSRRNTKGL